MDEYQHYKAFCAETGAVPYEHDYLSAVRFEAEDVREQTRRGYGRRCRYAEAVDTAAGRVLAWFKNAEEYRDQVTADLPGFVVSHRRACVWAVLLGLCAQKEIKQ